MPPPLRIFFLYILYTLTTLPAAKCQQAVPTGPWEDLPHGISVNVTLNENFVTAYLKNTSSSPVEIVGDSRHLVHLFYLDVNHAKALLRDKSDVKIDVTSKGPGATIIPGGTDSTFRLRIELSPDELAAIQNFPVLCRFTVYVPASKQYFAIESTPKVLSSGQ